MEKSSLKIGWIGIRARKRGRSTEQLNRLGWLKLDHAENNNPGGFDFVRPNQIRTDFESMDWRPLAALGLDGIAIWITDYQWVRSLMPTVWQWQNRAIIEDHFNSLWPNGRRKP